ncbi:hypothetical protein chiPu_0023938, partial [Chiloscyllium punctatum]|nr:hypothetical protein [Chiloscyllium punctatum]
TPHQWVHVMITSDAEIDNKEAKKITLKTCKHLVFHCALKLQEMVNEQAQTNVELIQEEGHCVAVVASGPEGN